MTARGAPNTSHSARSTEPLIEFAVSQLLEKHQRIYTLRDLHELSGSTFTMRSSIACARCRRSKVKCINAGVDTTCRACEASGRECTYPPPVVGGSGGSGKREGGGAEEGGRDAKRHRPRKSASGVPMEGVRMGAAIKHGGKSFSNSLDPTLLTPKVWQEIVSDYRPPV